ncbi:protein disulfide-isomerase domain [Exophiala mesophila]|uniref:protein disulfide-isomerase n=1 Tax=Exophiala mesophila TaxID=212818 RepID=A0A0D1ZAS8_EXOME|nr:protein disulfide-isomerase domain [Exophiala mesophila]KIV91787.1 protein disulfide-isomerase domain [Exophiala mesophila]
MARSLDSIILTLTLIFNLFFPVHAIYSKDSPVLQVNARTYNSLIAQSNHTSIVEFYAPWCGHCQNLKPAYEKAAKNLAGYAKVAAIDCDEEANKPFCGQMGVQGFPTLKIVKPGSKPGRPIVEDYTGPRAAKAIVEAVKDKIPNHVKKLQDSALDSWLKDDATTAKAVVFSDKPISPLVKSLAVDFLGNIAFAQVKDKASAKTYGVSEFPSILLFPAPGKDAITYDGEINRGGLLAFFAPIASPNPDPAPKPPKSSKSAKSAKSSKKAQASSSASAQFSRASEDHKSSDFEDFVGSSATIVLDGDGNIPTDIPISIVVDGEQKPAVVAHVPQPLPTLATSTELNNACLAPKSGNCILVLLPVKQDPDEISITAMTALAGFAEIVDRAHKRKANLLPIYAVPGENEGSLKLRQDLDLSSEHGLEIVAINTKRGWWRHYSAKAYNLSDLEGFIDAIKLGEGSKNSLPPSFTAQEPEPEPEQPEPELVQEADPSPDHDEL